MGGLVGYVNDLFCNGNKVDDLCTIGKVQGKAALAVAASHRKLGLRAVCVYQHQPVTGYDIGIHHHVQGDIDLGNAVTADQGHGHNTLTICQRTVEDRQTREVGVGGSNCLQSGRIFLRTGGNIYPMAGQNACLIQVEVYIGIGNQSRNHFLFLKDKATICTMAALSQANGAVSGSHGGIHNRGVAFGRAFIGLGVSYITTVTLCGFGAVLSAGGIVVADVVGKAVIQSRNRFLCNQDFVADRAVAALSQACFGAGCCNSRVNHFGVVGGGDNFLCNQDFVADRAVAALSQACFGAGCCNSRVNHFGVVGGGDNFLGDQYFITVTAVATFSQARFGAGGSYGNIFNYVCMIVGIDRKALCRNDIVTAFALLCCGCSLRYTSSRNFRNILIIVSEGVSFLSPGYALVAINAISITGIAFFCTGGIFCIANFCMDVIEKVF